MNVYACVGVIVLANLRWMHTINKKEEKNQAAMYYK